MWTLFHRLLEFTVFIHSSSLFVPGLELAKSIDQSSPLQPLYRVRTVSQFQYDCKNLSAQLRMNGLERLLPIPTTLKTKR